MVYIKVSKLLKWTKTLGSNDDTKEMGIMIEYLNYRVSELSSMVRYLIGELESAPPTYSDTYQSFNHQWGTLNKNKALLSDKQFRKSVADLICSYTNLGKAWFRDKDVLDAGCGNGRFTYGFLMMHAKVVSFDQSSSAIEQTRKNISDIEDKCSETFTHDILQPLPINKKFDLVWSYGVLHHTGNTYTGFKNIAPYVKPGGYLFIMLYGEPVLSNISSFKEQLEYLKLRRALMNKPFEEKIDMISKLKGTDNVHGWFDAVSPLINDTYSFEEIENWLLKAGFEDIHLTSESTNHHIIAKKIG